MEPCQGCGFGGAEPGVACVGCGYVNRVDYRSLSRAQRQISWARKQPTLEQRMLELLKMRWPQPPPTPRQRLVELYRLKGQWLNE